MSCDGDGDGSREDYKDASASRALEKRSVLYMHPADLEVSDGFLRLPSSFSGMGDEPQIVLMRGSLHDRAPHVGWATSGSLLVDEVLRTLIGIVVLRHFVGGCWVLKRLGVFENANFG